MSDFSSRLSAAASFDPSLRTDGHVHLEHGPLTVDYVMKFVEEARRKHLDCLQILDHTHRFQEFMPVYEDLRQVPVQEEWLRGPGKFQNSLEEYYSLIDQVRRLELPLEVRFGLEVCYTPAAENFLAGLLPELPLDFLVGAVHSVDGRLYDMPFSEEILWNPWGTDKVYRRYYELLLACVRSGLFTQLAHPDTVKLLQRVPSYDLTPTYRALAKALRDQAMLAENNVGCHYRYHHPDKGLSEEFRQILTEAGVPIINASDAHDPWNVGKVFAE